MIFFLNCNTVKVATRDYDYSLKETIESNIFKIFRDAKIYYPEEIYFDLTLWDSKSGVVRFSLSPTQGAYYNRNKGIRIEDLSRLPNQFINCNGRYFYWYDSNSKPNDFAIVDELKSHGYLTHDDELIYLQFHEGLNDDREKIITYSFCKRNIGNYVRVRSNKLHMHDNAHNKLDCK